MISVFISNDHLEIFRRIRFINCPLWNIWFQNVLGLGLWITILVCRLLIYARAFGYIKKGWRLIILYSLLIMIPIILISILITVFSGDSYNSEMQTCHTTPFWKGMLWIWIVCISILVYILIKRYGQKIPNIYANEYKELIEILFLGLLLFILYIFVNITFGFHTSFWRSIATFLIALLHLVTNLRICLSVIINYSKNSVEYDQIVMTSFCSYDQKTLSDYPRLLDIKKDFRIWQAFKFYTSTLTIDEKILPENYEVKTGKFLTTKFLIEAIDAFDVWNNGFQNVITTESNLYRAGDIIKLYVLNSQLKMSDNLEKEYPEPSENVYSSNKNELSTEVIQINQYKFNNLENYYLNLLEKLYFESFKQNSLQKLLNSDPQLKEYNQKYQKLEEEKLVPKSGIFIGYNFSGEDSQEF